MQNKETKIIKIEKENFLSAELSEAGAFIASGALVAFPTETVYGLGANALDPAACAAIFAAKGRPADNPLIVHIAEAEDLAKIAEPNQWSKKLAEACWPGPLTMILPKKDCVPDIVTAGLPSVAVRLPAHPIARELIRVSGCPIAAPSANTSTRPSPTLASHVAEDMCGRIEMIIDGGAADIGIESTVIDLTGEIPCILRPGRFSAEDLRPILGEVCYVSKDPKKSVRPASPGMKYTHYAPHGKVIAASAEKLAELFQKEQESKEKRMLILCAESVDSFPEDEEIFIISRREDLESYARNLFAAFRLADAKGAELIFVEKVAEEGLGIAIMNRLSKAAREVY